MLFYVISLLKEGGITMAIILLVISIILLVMGIKSMKHSKKKGIALIILAVFAVGSIGALGSDNEPKEPELTSTEQVQEGFGCSKGKAVQIEMILNECGLYDFVSIDEFIIKFNILPFNNTARSTQETIKFI